MIYKKTIFDKYTLYRDGSVYLGDLRLPQRVNQNGYLYVKLDGQFYPVHKLVASSFCDKPNGCDVVLHLDHNKHNNSAENLKWGTQAENVRMSIERGTHFNIGAYNKKEARA